MTIVLPPVFGGIAGNFVALFCLAAGHEHTYVCRLQSLGICTGEWAASEHGNIPSSRFLQSHVIIWNRRLSESFIPRRTNVLAVPMQLGHTDPIYDTLRHRSAPAAHSAPPASTVPRPHTPSDLLSRNDRANPSIFHAV